MINMHGFTFDVEVKKETLVAALEKHKAEHESDYQEAITTFKSEMVTKSAEAASRIAGGDFSSVPLNYGLTKPVNCSSQYADMITTFSSINSDVIKMDVKQLSTIMSNSWDWLSAANNINVLYSSSLRTKLGGSDV